VGPRQDFATIAPYTIEEAYEVADAIERNDMAALKDELGDLLFQVVFHAGWPRKPGCSAWRRCRGDRRQDGNGVIRMCSAMPRSLRWRRRTRPGSAQGRRAAGQRRRRKRPRRGGARPARAAAAAKISRRAARIGFDWPDARAVIPKLAEEIAELEAELDQGADPAMVEEEMGDLLFAAANLARKLDIEPETHCAGRRRNSSAASAKSRRSPPNAASAAISTPSKPYGRK